MRGATFRNSPSFSFLLSTREMFGLDEPKIISFWVSTLTAIQKSRLREYKGTNFCDYNPIFDKKLSLQYLGRKIGEWTYPYNPLLIIHLKYQQFGIDL